MQQTEFTDSFIKGMLGWIRWIASSIANMFQSGTGHSSGGVSMISWFADNWLKLLIALIVVGVLADWVVWMARWRPYWIWFRKRRILLDNDVDEIDDDDIMLRYGDMAQPPERRGAAGEDEYEPDLDDAYRERAYDRHERQAGYDEYDEPDEDARYDRRARYEDDEDEDAGYDRRGRYEDEDEEDGEDEPGRDPEQFDALYDDRYGDYADEPAGDDEAPREPPKPARAEPDEPDVSDDDDDVPHGRPARASVRKKGLFTRKRKVKRADEDPFSIEGDFFDDLGEDPMDDIVVPHAKVRLEPDAQDTSIYQRPMLLPGDEPGAVRGAEEDDGWHSGYTQRSAERKRRRKQDTRA